MTAYIAKANHMMDTLAAARKALNEGEVILMVLSGLGIDYDTFVTSITMRFDSSMSSINLQSMLLDQELRMGSFARVGGSISNVNVVNSPNKGKGGDIKYGSCQVCLNKGHSALNCYNRLNIAKSPPPSTNIG